MAVRTFEQFKNDRCRVYMGLDGLDPDNPIEYAEYRAYFERPEVQESLIEQYKESLIADKYAEERREKERQFKEEWMSTFSNEMHLKRLSLIYKSMLNIFKGWNGRIEEPQSYDPPRIVNAANAFLEDFIVVCMRVAAADKEIEESEIAWLNEIIGLHKTPAEYYKFYRDSREVSRNGTIEVLRSLIIATLIDINEGEKGTDVNADNVKKLFLQAAKTITTMDGEVKNAETSTCMELNLTLNKLHKEYKNRKDSRHNMRYRIPEDYTGSIRIE